MSDYKLVPVEPTPEMEQAGGAVYWKNIEDVCGIYRAMVAVAPAVQPTPDVAGLAEALVACGRASSAAEVGLIVDAALAAHRKGGEV